MVPLQNQPALLGTRGGVRRLILPLGSPEFPREVMRGRVIAVGIRGCTECMRGLTGKGVRMGMADIVDMDDRPTDRFGIEPIPVRRKHTGEREEINNTVSEEHLQKWGFLSFFSWATDEITLLKRSGWRRKAFECGGFLKLDTFLPKRADVGMVEAKLDTGDFFMMIGRDEGRFRP